MQQREPLVPARDAWISRAQLDQATYNWLTKRVQTRKQARELFQNREKLCEQIVGEITEFDGNKPYPNDAMPYVKAEVERWNTVLFGNSN